MYLHLLNLNRLIHRKIIFLNTVLFVAPKNPYVYIYLFYLVEIPREKLYYGRSLILREYLIPRSIRFPANRENMKSQMPNIYQSFM